MSSSLSSVEVAVQPGGSGNQLACNTHRQTIPTREDAAAELGGDQAIAKGSQYDGVGGLHHLLQLLSQFGVLAESGTHGTRCTGQQLLSRRCSPVRPGNGCCYVDRQILPVYRGQVHLRSDGDAAGLPTAQYEQRRIVRAGIQCQGTYF